EDGKVLPWPAPESRTIEFIGDSITCGYGIEADGPDNPFRPSEENFCDTYAYRAATALNADFLVVARSGIGMLRNYGGPADGSPDNMPAIYERTLFKSETPLWDASRFTPDVVCINLNTNDFSNEGPNVDKFRAAYVDFVHRIQKRYPHAKIVLLQGPMNNDPKVQAILKQVAAECTEPGGHSVTYFEMSRQGDHGFGAHYHPSQKQAEINGAELTQYLRELMDWN
ncbi:MAG: SGNH/GDSL hydrolase family protein, partial [Puniceicoccales bacterium]